MRYFLDKTTLVIRGSFRTTGTASSGRILSVSTILNHTIPCDRKASSLKKELELAAARAGAGRDYTGFVTTVPVQTLCIFKYDFLTVFITAAHRGRERATGHTTLTVIICSSRMADDAALVNATGTIREAVAKDADAAGLFGTGPSTPVIVAAEVTGEPAMAGGGDLLVTHARATLRFGIAEAVRRSTLPPQPRPAFFVFSRFKGEHWVEWTPENCPYYPCHFAGQRCDYCYCPLYPCGDESLGQWAESMNGGKIWNCASCTMIHEPAVADYLQKNPEAPKDELVRVWKRAKKDRAGT